MKKFIILILISTLCMCLKCKDSMLPEGIQTNIKGVVYDRVNEIPIVDQKIIIEEINYEPGLSPGSNIGYYNEIDSTYTDENGNYEITFETTGKGDTYRLAYGFSKEIWTYQKNPIVIKNIGGSQVEDFDFLHLYPVDLKITLASDLENLPIRISPRFTFLRSSDWLEQTNIENIRRIFTDKNSEEEIRFFRTKPDGGYQVARFAIPVTNTVDLVEIEIFLENSDFEDTQ